MRIATVRSVCECQAQLGADLDEHRHVIRGWAKDTRQKSQDSAPATAIGAENQLFDVAWLCPLCTRNTLRSFDNAGLVWRNSSEPELRPHG
jgi:hypothetical protein